jgi:hypothetical protein
VSWLILRALVSTVTLVESDKGVAIEVSILTFVESEVVVESVFESLQAAKIDATANAKNTFFIFEILIRMPLIQDLKKGNPLI